MDFREFLLARFHGRDHRADSPDLREILLAGAAFADEPLPRLLLAVGLFHGLWGLPLHPSWATEIAKPVMGQAKRLAKKNDADAMILLGETLSNAVGSSLDAREGAAWIKRGIERLQAEAQAGSVGAMIRLAWMHEEGALVDRDGAIARHWYKMAAWLGHPLARSRVKAPYADSGETS